jgi:GNAT superfamily N-acetyltransferase
VAAGGADVEIRSAREEDVAALVGLIVGGSLVEGASVPADLAPYRTALREIVASAGDLLVAARDGDVVGMCQLIVFRHLQADGGLCAEIESMHVRADCRSGGIGAVLLAAAIERARGAGCYRVQLTSNKARHDAHRFYERHGFADSHEGFKLYLE